MSEPHGAEFERGPKGGRKHRPGRGHQRKSKPPKIRRFRKRMARQRREQLKELRRQWDYWDSLSEEQKRLLPEFKPDQARPTDE